MSIRSDGQEEQAQPIAMSDADVLCGRGKLPFNHAGNKRFQTLVKESRTLFLGAKNRNERQRVVDLVIDSVRKFGGRFLKEDSSTGQWSELTDKEAKAKVGHAIRDSIKFQERAAAAAAGEEEKNSKSLTTLKHQPYEEASANTGMPQGRQPPALPMQPGDSSDSDGSASDRKVPASNVERTHHSPLQHPPVMTSTTSLLPVTTSQFLPRLSALQPQPMTTTTTTLQNIITSSNGLADPSGRSLALIATAPSLMARAPNTGTAFPTRNYLSPGLLVSGHAFNASYNTGQSFHQATEERKQAEVKEEDLHTRTQIKDEQHKQQSGDSTQIKDEEDKQQSGDSFLETINSVLGPLPPNAEDPLKPLLQD